MKKSPFVPADLLLPKRGFEKWACIACDQFTSEPEYWLEAERFVGGDPSALRCILPEVWLGGDDAGRVEKINATMTEYLESGVFEEYPDSMVYVERTLPDGKVRRGIVGAVDLEEYDFAPGSKSAVRATEATVMSRIPPRVAVRRGAPIELPHVMLLCDDPDGTVIEKIDPAAQGLEKLYDFDLMQGGGRIRGWRLTGADVKRVTDAIAALDRGGDAPLICVGDGNHSLASARECYRLNPTPRNRYAAAELVNIYDPALVFEPIYRVVFGCDPDALLEKIKNEIPAGGTSVKWCAAAGSGSFTVDGLPADVLQRVIDDYVAAHPGASCDYVHDDASALSLGKKDGASIAFLFAGMDKSELFPYVTERGALPRKTFSMGEARSKRYYIEARKIDGSSE